MLTSLAVRVALAALVVALHPVPAGSQTAGRVSDIQRRGYVSCGVWPEVRGFASVDAQGRYSGMDVDVCRAVAAAILGDPGKTRFVETETVDRFLASPEIDLVARRLTWSLRREGQIGLRFGPVTFYDGQGFLVPRRLGISRVRQLSGRRVCVLSGMPAEFNLGPYFRAARLTLEQVLIDSQAGIAEAFRRGRCHAYTADVTMLGSIRSTFARPADFDILPEMISKEPLAPVVRRDDDTFFDVLRWTLFVLINAEELGVTSANVDRMLESDDPAVQRLLGVAEGNGAALGLRERWAYDVVKMMGNYGEMFERNVGRQSAIGLARGINRLWTAGGLMWAPPAR